VKPLKAAGLIKILSYPGMPPYRQELHVRIINNRMIIKHLQGKKAPFVF
jgi:hypothetical protein